MENLNQDDQPIPSGESGTEPRQYISPKLEEAATKFDNWLKEKQGISETAENPNVEQTPKINWDKPESLTPDQLDFKIEDLKMSRPAVAVNPEQAKQDADAHRAELGKYLAERELREKPKTETSAGESKPEERDLTNIDEEMLREASKTHQEMNLDNRIYSDPNSEVAQEASKRNEELVAKDPFAAELQRRKDLEEVKAQIESEYAGIGATTVEAQNSPEINEGHLEKITEELFSQQIADVEATKAAIYANIKERGIDASQTEIWRGSTGLASQVSSELDGLVREQYEALSEHAESVYANEYLSSYKRGYLNIEGLGKQFEKFADAEDEQKQILEQVVKHAAVISLERFLTSYSSLNENSEKVLGYMEQIVKDNPDADFDEVIFDMLDTLKKADALIGVELESKPNYVYAFPHLNSMDSQARRMIKTMSRILVMTDKNSK